MIKLWGFFQSLLSLCLFAYELGFYMFLLSCGGQESGLIAFSSMELSLALFCLLLGMVVLDGVGGVALLCISISMVGVVFSKPILLTYYLESMWLGVDNMFVVLEILVVFTLLLAFVFSCNDYVVCGLNKEVVNSKEGLELLAVVISLMSVIAFGASGWFYFYFFFESCLVPTFFMVLFWGYQPERLRAALLLIVYTVVSSIPLLVCLVSFELKVHSDNFLFVYLSLSDSLVGSGWVWFCISLSFLVNCPVYFLHGWLPKAHVEAPLIGSILLAGVLLKLGCYGLIRFIWAFKVFEPVWCVVVSSVAAFGGVISCCLCLVQSDLKSMIAYSSISHMGLCVVGIVSLNQAGNAGAVGIIFSHGVCSSCLFALAACVYDWSGSRSVILSKGLLRVFPVISGLWFMFCAFNAGLPPFLGFFSEVICIYSVCGDSYIYWGVLGAICFLSGCYSLYIYSVINHGGVSVMVNSLSCLGYRYISGGVFVGLFMLESLIYLDFFLG